VAAVDAIGSPVVFEHVEGHQDTKYPDQPLPWEAQLNQCCDEIATEHLAAATLSLPTVTFLPASRVSLFVGNHTITHHIPTQLRTFAGLPAGIRVHFTERHQWESPAIFDLIDWPLHHAANLSNSFLKRLFVIKWINALLPFQHQQHQFNQSPTANCPSACGCKDETWHHFPRCPHPQRQESWTAFIPVISSVMERWTVDPSLWRLLLHLLVPLTTLQPIPLTDLKDEYLMLLETAQRSIGEDSLLFGFLSTEWLRLQDRYLHTLGLPRS
jgi:hypothetical protein